MTNTNESKWREFWDKVKQANYAIELYVECEKLKAELNELRTQLATTRSENEQLQKSLKKQVETYQVEFNHQRNKLLAARETVQKMQKLRDEDNLTFREIAKKHKELTEENARLKDEIAYLRLRDSGLTEKLRVAEMELAKWKK